MDWRLEVSMATPSMATPGHRGGGHRTPLTMQSDESEGDLFTCSLCMQRDESEGVRGIRTLGTIPCTPD